MADDQGASVPAQSAGQPGGAQAPVAVDVNKLADKVYRLLLADLRLSLVRGERLPASGRWER